MWDKTTVDNTECVLVGASTLHQTEYVLVGQEYTAQYRLIQTMYLWDTKTLHNTDYVLVGH